MAPCYGSRRSDIWALGVILVNMTTGRCPWEEASLADDCFAAYMRSKSWLRSQLPASKELAQLLRGVFTGRHSQSIDLATLKEQVQEIGTFFMTVKEVRKASRAVKESASYLTLPEEPLKPILIKSVSEIKPLQAQRRSSEARLLNSDDASSDDSDSATNSDADWEESTPGVRMRTVLPIITDPDFHEGQAAWRKDKQAAIHLDKPAIANYSPSVPGQTLAPPPRDISPNAKMPPPSSPDTSSSATTATTTTSTSASNTTPSSSNQPQPSRTLAYEIVTPSSGTPWMRWAVRIRGILGRVV